MADSAGFPRRFDSYVLLKPLAKGGMGELYLAASGAKGFEKPCVIKKVLPNLVAPDNMKRFRDEVMVVVKLSHGNLVSVFDAGRYEDQVYLVMEFVDGKDLLCTWNRCAERRVPFPVDVAAYIIKELARGLGYAHGFGNLKLVHRDVSPANVLLSYTGEVKLTDFGLATSTLKLQHTAPGIIFGKLSYLSPEQARSEPLDGRTDLYAAGILLWELLTGQQLFPVRSPPPGQDLRVRKDSTAEALDRVRNPRVLPPSSVTSRVPAELDRIAMRALAPDRERRYQSGEELRADLAAFLAKTAPETDAARLAAFLRPLFSEDMERDHRDRESLMQGAGGLLSGAIDAAGPSGPPSRHAVPGPTVPASDPRAVPAPVAQASAVARPGEDPRIGSTLGGRYFVRRLCGEGAMGRVYEGHHVDIGRRVAIKILHSSYRHSEELVERFRREARAASKIGHANIVDVTDSGITPDGAFYFVMEYLDGVDLEQLIEREGPLPVTRALLITAQIGRALQAAHDAEIVHRDLKPANVMLVNRKDEEDFVKVLDFGISRNLDLESPTGRRAGLTRPDVAVGTPTYMSPEQAAGMPADALTDVYAVGGLLYEMLTGKPPCDGDDVIAVLNKKATEDPVAIGRLRPELPLDVQQLVTRALARHPKDRQPSMAVLKEEVLSCLAFAQGALVLPAAPLRAMTPQPRSRSTKVSRFHPRSWMLVAASFALLGLTAVASFVRHADRGDDPDESAAAAAPAPGETPEAVPGAPGAGSRAGEAALAQAPAGSSPVRLAPAAEVAGRTPPLLHVRQAGPKPQLGLMAPAPHAATVLEPAEPVAWPTLPSSTTAPPPVVAPLPSAGLPRRTQGQGAGREPRETREPADQRAAIAQAPVAGDEGAKSAAAMRQETIRRGQNAFNEGNYAEAVRRAREAVSDGSPVAGHLLLGDAYYHLQRYADAMREYQSVLAVEPANALARRGRELAERAAAAP